MMKAVFQKYSKIYFFQIFTNEKRFQTTDFSLLEKLHFVHSANPLYGKPRMSTPEFIIKHYAGEVIYEVRNFLDKNRDLLRTDVIDMFINSRNSVRIYFIFLCLI